MKATLYDPRALARIPSLDLATYLRVRGWKEIEHEAGRFSLWVQEVDAGRLEALLPLDSSFRDYPARMADLLSTLELAEERPRLEILSDITNAVTDLVRVRALPTGVQEGSIRLDSGIELIANARELMLAAACAALEPRRHYPTRKPTRATEYVESLELGQTERGSYVLTIFSPVPPSLQGDIQAEESGEEPFERRVTETLLQASLAARRAAEESATTGRLQPFEQAVAQGVSANLCDALSGLSEAGGDRMELSVHWAMGRRAKSSKTPEKVVIGRDTARLFQEASRLFKASEPEESFELEGYVIALKRDEGSETGSVTVIGPVDGILRKVRIELGDPAYEKAIEAHRRELSVRCRGTMVREARQYSLREPHGFSVDPVG